MVKRVFFPNVTSRRQRLLTLTTVSVVQSGLTALLFSVASPVRALVLAVAASCAVAIVLSSHFGIYLLATILIGQWPSNLTRYLLMLVAATVLAKSLLYRKPLFSLDPVLLLTGGYALLVLVSTINPLTRVELWPGALTYLGHFVLVWIFATQIESRETMRMVLRLMVISGVITALIGLVQAYTHFLWPTSTTARALTLGAWRGRTAFELQNWEGIFRIDSITGTPDMLPLYLQTLLPFVCFWSVRQWSQLRKALGIFVILLFGVTHLLSFTRGAMLTTVLVLLLTAWMIDRRRLVVLGPTLALLSLASLLIWSPMRDRVISIVTLEPQRGVESHLETGMWRLKMLPIGVEMLFERPVLGMGVNQHQYNWPSSARDLIVEGTGDLAPLHNSYLVTGIEIGLSGFTVLLLLIFVAGQRLYRTAARFRLMGELELAHTAQASLAALVGIACAMLMYPMLDSFRYFWLLLSLACALPRLEESLSRTPSGIHHTTAVGPTTTVFRS